MHSDFIETHILPIKTKYADELSRIKAVADVICQQAVYDEDVYAASLKYKETGLSTMYDDAHHLTGFLTDRKVVCDGYAEIFQACMYELDIPCISVLGFSSSGKTCHEWNKVYLNG